VDDLPEKPSKPGKSRRSSRRQLRPLPLEEIRRQHIRRVLDACEGNRVRAAHMLGIGRTKSLSVPETVGEETRQHVFIVVLRHRRGTKLLVFGCSPFHSEQTPLIATSIENTSILSHLLSAPAPLVCGTPFAFKSQ